MSLHDIFSECTLCPDVFLVICQLVCAEMISATLCNGFLVFVFLFITILTVSDSVAVSYYIDVAN